MADEFRAQARIVIDIEVVMTDNYDLDNEHFSTDVVSKAWESALRYYNSLPAAAWEELYEAGLYVDSETVKRKLKSAYITRVIK